LQPHGWHALGIIRNLSTPHVNTIPEDVLFAVITTARRYDDHGRDLWDAGSIPQDRYPRDTRCASFLR
jgi:hypothetical protein